MLLPNLKCFALALLIGLLPGFRVYSQDFREQTVLNNYADNSDSLSSEYFQSNSQVQWHSIFTNIPKDFYLFGTTGVTGDNLKTLLGVGVTTGALFIFDDDLHQATKKILGSSPFLKKVSNVTVYLGDGKTSLALALGLSSYGLIAGDSKFTKTSVKIVESMLVSGIFVQFLKRITGRESPAAATTKCGMWRLFPSVKKYQGNQKKYYSFPSGHITTITSTMTVLNNCYPDSKFLKPLS